MVSLDDGAQLFSRGADEQLNPASNTKLLTAAAALVRLGPEYRFTTDVAAAVAASAAQALPSEGERRADSSSAAASSSADMPGVHALPGGKHSSRGTS